MKKLSARRKKSVFGRRMPRTRRMVSESAECDSRVAYAKWRDPPSGFSPAAIAIASTSVDLPLPFSPIRYVTFGSSASPSASADTAGSAHG